MYKDIMRREGIPRSCFNWKVKLPLKFKIFLWYLNKGVVLTKDNLVKRNWKGDERCVCCGAKESIQHLFFDCQMARLVWGAVSITFGFITPYSMSSMFGCWLKSFHSNVRKMMLIGVAAVCWSLWLTRSDVVFQRTTSKSSFAGGVQSVALDQKLGDSL
jgi:hypothetical protein